VSKKHYQESKKTEQGLLAQPPVTWTIWEAEQKHWHFEAPYLKNKIKTKGLGE
jgi:hypothetical protein